jgi:hypothetical protein
MDPHKQKRAQKIGQCYQATQISTMQMGQNPWLDDAAKGDLFNHRVEHNPQKKGISIASHPFG